MRLRCLVAIVYCAAAAQAHADDASERERLNAERAEIEARYLQRAQACQTDFFMTSCMDAAQAERRQALNRVRLQQEALDDAMRRRRAADRLQRIQEKVNARNAAASAPLREPSVRQPQAVTQPVPVSPREDAPAASAPARAASTPHRVNKPPAGAKAAMQERQEEAARHRAAVERKLAERAGKRAASLPLPASAASQAGAGQR